MRRVIAALVLLLGACFSSSLAAQAVNLTGHWEGAIVLVPAEQEVDLVVNFSQVGGQVKGQVQFPLTSDRAQEMENIKVQDSRLSFSVHDTNGVESAFEGAVSLDGVNLQGTLKESRRVMSFTLHRAKAAELTHEVSVNKLSGNGTELKNAFNADVGNVRMLLLLNATSFPSRVALRIVERYIMEQVNSPDLRVYVVWMTPNRPEAAKVVQRLAMLAPNPRITHFWSTDQSLSRVFEPMLAIYKLVSTPCMVFARNRSWADLAPLPDRFRQSPKIDTKDSVNPAEKLNGIALAADIHALLEADNR